MLPCFRAADSRKGLAGSCSPSRWRPADLLAQGAAARLPGSLNNNRMLDAWLRINADGTATVFTGKVELGPGYPDLARADRGRGARSAARAAEDDFRRHRPDAQRGHDRRLPVDREQRTGAATGRRRGAFDPDRSRRQEARRRRRHTEGGGRHDQRGRRPQGHLRRACRRGRSQARGNRQGRAEAAGGPQDRRPSRSPRLDIPAKVFGGAIYVQDMRPPGMVHGRVVRPPRAGSTLESFDEAAREDDARRDRGGARRLVPRRHRRARGAGDQGAGGAGQERQVEARAGTARSGQPLRASEDAAEQGPGDRRQAGAGAGRRRHARGDLHQALHGARLDRPVRRARRIRATAR